MADDNNKPIQKPEDQPAPPRTEKRTFDNEDCDLPNYGGPVPDDGDDD